MCVVVTVVVVITVVVDDVAAAVAAAVPRHTRQKYLVVLDRWSKDLSRTFFHT